MNFPTFAIALALTALLTNVDLAITKPIAFVQVSTTSSRADTTQGLGPSQSDSTLKVYQQILEKTNQQLSLWWNPYAILIASLSVLFTVLAIVAAVVIYLQSKEYRNRLDSLVSGYQGVLDKLIAEWNKKLHEIDAQVKNYQTELNNATGQQKEVIQAEIDKLHAQRDSVTSQIASTVTAMPLTGLLGIGGESVHRCSTCGYGFKVKTGYYPILGMAGPHAVTCPKCGNVDAIP